MSSCLITRHMRHHSTDSRAVHTEHGAERCGHACSVNAIGTSPAGAKYCDEFVCLCVWLSDRISPEPHARILPIFCACCLAVARSSSGTLMIGRIAYRREGGNGSAQRGRSVIYDCLVFSEFDTTYTHVTAQIDRHPSAVSIAVHHTYRIM